jgi:hypothetical protein
MRSAEDANILNLHLRSELGIGLNRSSKPCSEQNLLRPVACSSETKPLRSGTYRSLGGVLRAVALVTTRP